MMRLHHGIEGIIAHDIYRHPNRSADPINGLISRRRLLTLTFMDFYLFHKTPSFIVSVYAAMTQYDILENRGEGSALYRTKYIKENKNVNKMRKKFTIYR